MGQGRNSGVSKHPLFSAESWTKTLVRNIETMSESRRIDRFLAAPERKMIPLNLNPWLSMQDESFLRSLPLFPPISGIPSHWQSNNDRVRANSKRRPSPSLPFPGLALAGPIPVQLKATWPVSQAAKLKERTIQRFLRFVTQRPARRRRCLSEEMEARRGAQRAILSASCRVRGSR